MSRYLVLITILALCILQCQGQQMGFTMNPQTITLLSNETNTGKPMTLTCTLSSAPERLAVTIMQISRIRKNSATSEMIAQAALTLDGGAVTPILPGITVDGSTGERRGVVMFSAAKCSDRGMYTCTIRYIDAAGLPGDDQRSANLTVEVLPEKIELTADPSYETYRVGDDLTLSCNGIVGTTDDGTEVTWVWQYRDQSDFGSIWIEVDSDMVEADTPNNFPCYENQISILRLMNLSLADSGRTYRCMVRRKGQDYEQMGDSFLIQSVTESGDPANPGNTGGNTGAQKANVGLIVGLVIGILIVIIVVIVIVVFVMRRKRNNQGKNYGAGEDNKPKDEAVPPYTVDPNNPAVTYSQPNRFKNNSADRNNDRSDRQPPRGRGHSNPAMDDDLPVKKVNYEPQPARYENQGRHNRGYDRRSPHPDNDHYSSDGDANTSRYSVGDGDPTIGTAI